MSQFNRSRRRTAVHNSIHPIAFQLDTLEQRQLLSAAVSSAASPLLPNVGASTIVVKDTLAGQDSGLSLNGTALIAGAITSDFSGSDFGSAALGDHVDRTFTLTNNSDHTITIHNFSVTNTDSTPAPGAFSFSLLASDSMHLLSLLAGQSLTFHVILHPQSPGILSSVVTLGYYDGDVNPLTGTTGALLLSGSVSLLFSAAATPGFTITSNNNPILLGASPSPDNGTDFGSVPIGSSTTRHYTLTNTSDHEISILGINAPGPGFNLTGQRFEAEIIPHNLLPGESLSFDISFSPYFQGSAAGIINVLYQDGHLDAPVPGQPGTPYVAPYLIDFSLTGNGLPDTSIPSIGVSSNGNPIDRNSASSADNGTDFGTVQTGQVSVHEFTITNTSDHRISIPDIYAPSNNGGNGFSINLPAPLDVPGLISHGTLFLDPGQSFTFSVTFTAAFGGTFNTTINIHYFDSAYDPHGFQIPGGAIPPGYIPNPGRTFSFNLTATSHGPTIIIVPPTPIPIFHVGATPEQLSTARVILPQVAISDITSSSDSATPSARAVIAFTPVNPQTLATGSTRLPSLAPPLKFWWGPLMQQASDESALPTSPLDQAAAGDAADVADSSQAVAAALDLQRLAKNQP